MTTNLHITVTHSRRASVEAGHVVEYKSNAAPDKMDESILRNAGFPRGWDIKWDENRGPVDSWERIRAGQFSGAVLEADPDGGWRVQGQVVVSVTPGK